VLLPTLFDNPGPSANNTMEQTNDDEPKAVGALARVAPASGSGTTATNDVKTDPASAREAEQAEAQLRSAAGAGSSDRVAIRLSRRRYRRSTQSVQVRVVVCAAQLCVPVCNVYRGRVYAALSVHTVC
jgi:hypothetical protein